MGKSKWFCECDCGGNKIIAYSNLKRGATQSCGCLHLESIRKNIAGQRFGKLVAIEPTDKRGSNRQIIWKCQCDCGNIIEVRLDHLTSENTYSCGCLKQSQGEYKIEKILQEHSILYKKEYVFKDLYTRAGGHPRFDFAVLNQNNEIEYLIEYDGETHDLKKQNGWNKTEKIVLQQENDQIKNKYCIEHNIPLIRINYNHFSSLNINDLLLKENWKQLLME